MSTDTASNYSHWKIEYDDQNIAWLHLDMKDSKVNLLAGSVLEELRTVLDELAKNTPQGVIILSDKKAGFIFGADIKEFLELDDISQSQPFLDRGHEIMYKLEALPCPTVSMVKGMCLGGGMELSWPVITSLHRMTHRPDWVCRKSSWASTPVTAAPFVQYNAAARSRPWISC